MIPKMRMILGVAVIVSMLAACGYQLAGSGHLPQNITRIFVAEPVNHTADSALITNISNELKREFTRRQLKMVDDPNNADAMLSSEIVSLTDATITRRGETTSLEKRLSIRLDLKLKKQDGEVVWTGKKIVASETYTVISDNDLATENNRRTAIDELSKRLAEDSYNRLTVDF